MSTRHGKKAGKFLAFDLGASGGRAMAGIFTGKKFSLEEIHRFPNGPIEVNGTLRWDVGRLFSEIKKGLSLFVSKYGSSLDGIGIDTWGMDFGLFDKNGNLLEAPYCYRDKRTEGIEKDILDKIDHYLLYETTGMKISPITTLSQLYAMVKVSSPVLKKADFLLMMPGIFNYFLTGERAEEYTAVSPSCLYDIRKDAFAAEFFRKLSIPGNIMPRVVKPATIVGSLLPEIAKETGLGNVPVIAPACHDTASASVAVPAAGKSWGFISSGTWSVVGIETIAPVISGESFKCNLVNEGAAGNKFIAGFNITGLWILQQCKKAWEKGGERLDWPQIVKLAESARPFIANIAPDDSTFINPSDMPHAILEYCKNTDQNVPENKGEITRIALESLALKYKNVLQKIESLNKKPIEVLHIVGGGTQNKLLNQFTADATGKRVFAGPVEAAAIGNIIMQAIGTGYISSIAQAREIIRSSFEIEVYYPE